MSAVPSFEMHLFVRTEAENASDVRRLELPQSPSFLSFDKARVPEFTSASPASGREIGLLEPVDTAFGPRLLFLVSRAFGRGLRLNGQPLPRVALLRDGDRIAAPGGRSFGVALFRRPSVGPAGAPLSGRECPVCRTALAESTSVFRCPCGAAIHLDAAGENPAAEALECARLASECPICTRAIVLEAGYASDPER